MSRPPAGSSSTLGSSVVGKKVRQSINQSINQSYKAPRLSAHLLLHTNQADRQNRQLANYLGRLGSLVSLHPLLSTPVLFSWEITNWKKELDGAS